MLNFVADGDPPDEDGTDTGGDTLPPKKPPVK